MSELVIDKTEVETSEDAETVTAICGGDFPLSECVQLTLGNSAGEYVHEDDDDNEIVEHDDESWLLRDESDCSVEERYVRDEDGDLIDRDTAVFLDDRECWTHYDNSVFIEGEEICVHINNEEYAYSHRLGRHVCIYDDYLVRIDGDFYTEDEVGYCDSCGEYYVIDNGLCCNECEDREDRINEYHCSPSPASYIRENEYALGFEVEKTEVDGNDSKGEEVDVQPLFAGWETDSSCGVEGITNVYGLSFRDKFESHVDSSCYCDEDTSGSCGGHVNMSGPGLTLERVRPYAGLVYALYRHRLNNSFSEGNKKMEKPSSVRYAAIREKRHGLVEFRLVARVKNGGQLKWRFRLFSEIAKAIEIGIPFSSLLVNCSPLLAEVYSPEKHVEIVSLARHFQTFLDKGVIHSSISEFV